jgi:hypothetical protein
MSDELPRRVYRRELCAALGCGPTWFRELQKRGLIPRGQRDPGGKREWFTDDHAREILAKMNSAAEKGAAKAVGKGKAAK